MGRLTIIAFGVWVGVCGGSLMVYATPLNVALLASSPEFDGNEALFRGTIENQTGSDLFATDLFFDFFDYDPVVLEFAQELGDPEFFLADSATSVEIDLFRVVFIDGIQPGDTFSFGFLLQDVNGNVSDAYAVRVGDSNPVPEPTSGLLLIAGIALRTLARRNRRQGATR